MEKLKIIHLIRDPRAMISSSIKAGTIISPKKNRDKFIKNVSERCQQNLEDLKYGLKYLTQNQYRVIKYENVIMNFDSSIDNLLEYLNLSHYPKFDLFLNELKSTKNLTLKERKRHISLKRNLNEQSFAWRRKIELSIVTIVEEECSEFMDYVGYKKVNGSKSLLQNTSVFLL